MFWSLLAGMFCAWVAPPDVDALAERLMTKPLGSRVRAMVSTLGVVRTGLDGAVWELAAGPAGEQAPRSKTSPASAVTEVLVERFTLPTPPARLEGVEPRHPVELRIIASEGSESASDRHTRP